MQHHMQSKRHLQRFLQQGFENAHCRGVCKRAGLLQAGCGVFWHYDFHSVVFHMLPDFREEACLGIFDDAHQPHSVHHLPGSLLRMDASSPGLERRRNTDLTLSRVGGHHNNDAPDDLSVGQHYELVAGEELERYSEAVDVGRVDDSVRPPALLSLEAQYEKICSNTSS